MGGVPLGTHYQLGVEMSSMEPAMLSEAEIAAAIAVLQQRPMSFTEDVALAELIQELQRLKHQRDAAAPVLRSSENQIQPSLLTNAEAAAVAGVLHGCISDALAAFGAEETT